MATDFSIDTLLNLPSKESEQRVNASSVSIQTERLLPSPIGQFVSTGTCASFLRQPTNYLHRTPSHAKSSPSIDLTKFPAADFSKIVIPKKHSKPRRKRTAFSNIQLHFLEEFFQKKAYPSSQERNFIGSILNIGSGQVKTWYQNRRTKLKKNKLFDFEMDSMEAQQPSVSSTLHNGNLNRLESQVATISGSNQIYVMSHWNSEGSMSSYGPASHQPTTAAIVNFSRAT